MLGHWLFDAPFSATSMIGFIALAGIIVRNSILLVDFIRHAAARGRWSTCCSRPGRSASSRSC
jgi:multidrug efflux pump subunit AcrB